MYQLKYRRQARNYLAKLPFKIKSRIVDRLHEIQKDPDNPALDIDKLKGESGYRLRVGQYRIIYTRHEDQLIIEVVKIRPRGDIYKEVNMEYQTIKEKGKVKFVVLPVELFETLLDRLEDESDIRAIRDADQEPLYNQKEAEEYIFMNPVKRERLERGWTQKDLADRLEVKQSTVAKWERKEAVFRKKTRQKLARIFGVNEETFL